MPRSITAPRLLAVLLLATACSTPPTSADDIATSVAATPATKPTVAPATTATATPPVTATATPPVTATPPASPATPTTPATRGRLVADVPAGYAKVSADMPGLDADTRRMIESGDIFLLDEGDDGSLIAHALTGGDRPARGLQ